ncbi:unnamed protein product [Angiostrongylus costaricensis]|uniref:DNA-binding protein n=1 Tax=Angiostrongylus costaricensis TaxID=334426 RepID=A0A0R3PAD4_ANGCS|nr:unnamed protein product [Angiostrongylus costaricensis]
MLIDSTITSMAEQNLANYVLDGGLLPMNNNVSFIAQDSLAVTAVIVDENDTAYCVLGVVAEGYKGHTIWIEETPSEKKELCVYKIIRSVPYIMDYKAPTLFETVFADHKGSIAHQEVVAEWRDVAGFIVSDKHRLEEVLVHRSNLLSLSDPTSTIVIVNITKGNLVSVLDYDADLSIYDRSEHVTALIQTPGITGMLALDEGRPCGYALLCKNRVLLLYANNEEIFKQLLSGIAKDIVSDQCKMFIRLGAHNVTEQIIEVTVSSIKK